jgi:hypothetical protein
MKGRKGGTDEGSVRATCFIRWPAKIPRGHTVPEITAAIDLLPTLTALAGVPRVGDKPLDGRDLSPLLLGRTTEWPDRMIFSSWNGDISVRTARHRLDRAGNLFDPVADPGQTRPLNTAHPEIASRLSEEVGAWRREMFGQDRLPTGRGSAVDPRPIPVGYAEFPVTTLPARDGEPRGGVRRSSSAPNSSYFVNWTTTDDRLVWELEVHTRGDYEVVVDYTCPIADAGSLIELAFLGSRLSGVVTPGWAPPLYTNQDTLPRPSAESRMKEFRPLHLGTIRLEEGRGALTLRALDIPGGSVMDLRRLTLTLLSGGLPAAESR